MNNLIRIEVNDKMQQMVSGRELHEFLEVGARYNDWFPRMVEYGFVEGIDFYSILSESTGGRPSTDHQLMIETAKEISMIQRNEKGQQARRYFLRIEKAWNDPEMVMARSLQFANQKLISFEERINRLTSERNELKSEVHYKSEVIAGLLPAMDIYQKRTVLNRVVRHKKADVRARWAELYKVFTASYHVDLKARCEGHNLKEPKKSKHLSVVAYAERFGYLDNLYDIAVRLYETDISEIVESLKKIS